MEYFKMRELAHELELLCMKALKGVLFRMYAHLARDAEMKLGGPFFSFFFFFFFLLFVLTRREMQKCSIEEGLFSVSCFTPSRTLALVASSISFCVYIQPVLV
jgi:hypothetical protein